MFRVVKFQQFGHCGYVFGSDIPNHVISDSNYAWATHVVVPYSAYKSTLIVNCHNLILVSIFWVISKSLLMTQEALDVYSGDLFRGYPLYYTFTNHYYGGMNAA